MKHPWVRARGLDCRAMLKAPSYHNPETKLFTIYPYYANLN